MVFTGAGGMRAERSGWHLRHSREMSSPDPHTARGGLEAAWPARGISMAYLLLVSWPLKHADTVSNGFYTFLHSQKLPLKMPPCTAQPSSHPSPCLFPACCLCAASPSCQTPSARGETQIQEPASYLFAAVVLFSLPNLRASCVGRSGCYGKVCDLIWESFCSEELPGRNAEISGPDNSWLVGNFTALHTTSRGAGWPRASLAPIPSAAGPMRRDA